MTKSTGRTFMIIKRNTRGFVAEMPHPDSPRGLPQLSSQGHNLLRVVPAHDWTRLRYKGLAISTQQETLLKCTWLELPLLGWRGLSGLQGYWRLPWPRQSSPSTFPFTDVNSAISPLHKLHLGVCFLEDLFEIHLGKLQPTLDVRVIPEHPPLFH